MLEARCLFISISLFLTLHGQCLSNARELGISRGWGPRLDIGSTLEEVALALIFHARVLWAPVFHRGGNVWLFKVFFFIFSLPITLTYWVPTPPPIHRVGSSVYPLRVSHLWWSSRHSYLLYRRDQNGTEQLHSYGVSNGHLFPIYQYR